jgi:hypothetical protein
MTGVNAEESEDAFARERPREKSSLVFKAITSGGFPSRFCGDYTIARPVGDKSFFLHFFHDTIVSLIPDSYYSTDFFKKNISLDGARRFTLASLTLDAAASYELDTLGLQGQSAELYDITRQFISGEVAVSTAFSNNFFLNGALAVHDVLRFAGLEHFFKPALQNSNAYQTLPARASLLWRHGDYRASFEAQYRFDGAQEYYTKETAHMGETRFLVGKQFNPIDVSAALAIFYGDKLTLPFTLSVSSSTIAFLQNSGANFSVSGGLVSFRQNLETLEKQNPFTLMSSIPKTASDWFFASDAQFSFNNLSAAASVAFKKTAFGRGITESNYASRDAASDLFAPHAVDRTSLDTHIGFSATTGIVYLSLAWNASWLHANTGIQKKNTHKAFVYTAILAQNAGYAGMQAPPHSLALSTALLPKSERWGAHFDSGFFFSGDVTPDFSLGGFYRFNIPSSSLSSVSLGIEIFDAVKFISAKTRMFADPYIATAGSVNIFFRFEHR